VLINANSYGLVLTPKVEKNISKNLGGQFAILRENVLAFIKFLTSMF
jgi:uncharacterized protein (DUF697 family)